MDAPGERFFLIVRQPVERFERDPEQTFRAQAPVRAVTVLPVEQLHHEAAHTRSTLRRIGGRLWRRSSRSFGTPSHREILPWQRIQIVKRSDRFQAQARQHSAGFDFGPLWGC
jgi:hypothetical protein